MGRGGDAACTVLCGVLTLIAAIVSSALLGVSFGVVQPGTQAHLLNSNTRQLFCDQLYGGMASNRRYFVGLGQGFNGWTYPLAVNNIRYTPDGLGVISTRTREGAIITLQMAVQYQLPRDPASLCNVLYTYGNDYDAFLRLYLLHVARNALMPYAVYDLWGNRQGVGASLRAAVAAEVTARGFTFFGAQMLSLNIPTALQNEIENTTVQFQGIAQASLNLQQQNVSAVTTQLQAQVTGQIAVLNATYAANATLLDANARATVLNVTAVAEAAGYAVYKSNFNMSNQQVLTLAYFDAVQRTAAQKLLLSVDPPSLVRPSI